jgi:hypothetical protein
LRIVFLDVMGLGCDAVGSALAGPVDAVDPVSVGAADVVALAAVTLALPLPGVVGVPPPPPPHAKKGAMAVRPRTKSGSVRMAWQPNRNRALASIAHAN